MLYTRIAVLFIFALFAPVLGCSGHSNVSETLSDGLSSTSAPSTSELSLSPSVPSDPNSIFRNTSYTFDAWTQFGCGFDHCFQCEAPSITGATTYSWKEDPITPVPIGGSAVVMPVTDEIAFVDVDGTAHIA